MALTDHGSPYADILRAVCDTLPGPSPADRAQALALARGGPPTETVGLAPFSANPSSKPSAAQGTGR